MKKYLFSLFVFCLIGTYAQCPKPTRILKSESKSSGFSVNSQSRCGLLRVGEVFETVIVVQSGNDYKFNIAPETEGIGKLVYEIYENVVKKNTDNGKSIYKKTKEVLFSSNNEEAIEFRTDQTRKIHVKVMIEGEDSDQLNCVALLIETKRSDKSGF
jgi:hypothetical protein